MTQEELEEEICAINAIYPGSVEYIGPQIYVINAPNNSGLKIQVSFPTAYPEEQPSIIQVLNSDTKRFPDTNYLEGAIKSKMSLVFRQGEVCLFEFLNEIEEFLHNCEDERQTNASADQPEKEKKIQVKTTTNLLEVKDSKTYNYDPLSDWTQSLAIIDRGSTFIAYAREARSVEDAEEFLNILLTDKKISKANHNINAWRIKGEGSIQYQDCDDDGETAAGGRLLHLLQVSTHFQLFIRVFVFMQFLTTHR